MDAPLLGYESNRYDALEAGEQAIWEGSPLPSRKLRRYAATIAVFGVVLVICLSFIVIWMLLLALVSVYVVITSFWLLKHYYDETIASRRKYLITSRRFAVLHPRKQLRMSMQPTDLTSVTLRITRDGPSVFAGGNRSSVAFDRPPNARELQNLILSFPQRLGRRFLVRRGRPFAAPMPMPTMVLPMSEFQLQAGEVLLWSGRPRAWDPINRDWWMKRLKLAGTAIIPTIMLGLSIVVGRSNAGGAGPWFFGIIGGLWLFGVLRNIFYEPFSSARRRRRMTYHLTNVRAVIEERGRQLAIRSILLDMIDGVSVSTSTDGVGDIGFTQGFFRFERVEHAAEVHRMLIDAVRAAGGPLPGQELNAANP